MRLPDSHHHCRSILIDRALVTYMAIADRGEGWPSVLNGPPLRQGMQGPRVESLRRRLLATGELQRLGDNPVVFDRIDQCGQGISASAYLEADGVVGKAALSALDVCVIERINADLASPRTQPLGPPDTTGHLYHCRYRRVRSAVPLSGQTGLDRAGSGGQAHHQTPVFRSEIRQMVLNPTWTIPVNIANREILPQVLKSPSYLAEQKLRVLDADGREIAPSQINFRKYAGKSFPYTFRQDAGPDAALGRIKFSFENPYSVYLHDTPSKALFDKTSRAFSHGCIRVQDPLALAQLLLRNDSGNTTGYASFDRILQGENRTDHVENTCPGHYLVLDRPGQGWKGLFQTGPLRSGSARAQGLECLTRFIPTTPPGALSHVFPDNPSGRQEVTAKFSSSCS